MKPTFLIIGAMKCATTSICDLLAEHPQIYLCHPKEPEYFCKDEIHARGAAWYESLFAPAGAAQARGEGSTSYTKCTLFPHTADRIANELPGVKLIYVVRHPLERLESHVMHTSRAEHRESRSIAAALKRHPHYVDTSMYWKQISRYCERFAEDQIHVVFFEDFCRDPNGSLAAICRFLDVDDAFRPAAPERPRHVSSGALFDSNLLQRMRASGPLRTLAHYVPRSLRRHIERPLQRRLHARPRWEPEVRRHVVDQVGPDARQFLDHYGKPADFWQFDS